MQVIHGPGDCPPPGHGAVVTIGAYDGLHRGHRAVIAQVRGLAADRGAASAVVTFDRHPASVVRPDSAPKLLTDLAQKLELLAATAVDYAHVVHFDHERAHESAEDFVKEVLLDCLHTRVIVVGEDFHFGHQRRGDVALLRRMGEAHGFEVVPVELIALDGDDEPVSSTAIRAALGTGDVGTATRLLGRPYEVRGLVVTGDRRGRELGFPTANVSVPDDVCLPADGIYAGWYERPDASVHAAAISLGRRPTFYEQAHQSLLEAHLLDFHGDLYGEPARVRFTHWVRGQERFDTVEALVGKVQDDLERCRALLVAP